MRKCGDCALCCKLMAVSEFDKPSNVWCIHSSHKKCNVYETRPEECRTYKCLWLAGYLPINLTPMYTQCIMWLRGNTLVITENIGYKGNAIYHYAMWLDRLSQAGYGIQIIYNRDCYLDNSPKEHITTDELLNIL